MSSKVIIVTGASSGIGRATAVAFAKRGMKLVLAARRAEDGAETVAMVEAAGGEAIFVPTDVTQAAQMEALVTKTLETFGRLDAAFNNAGSGSPSALTELTESAWDYEIAVNLKSVWLGLKYQIPAMLRTGGGAIVNTSSQGAILGVPNYAAYGAAKGGVISLTRAAAAEYASQGIRVNSVSPGAVKTDLWAAAPPDMLAEVAAGIPLKRIGAPEDIAETVVWLCSDAAAFITGQNIVADGGYTSSN